MAKHTKKVGVTGKYGTRYGQKLRKQVRGIEILQRTKSICSFCGKTAIKRVACGIWKCKGCKRVISGGCWDFVTTAATTAKTTINRLKRNLELRKAPEQEEEDEEEVKQSKKDQKKDKKDSKKDNKKPAKQTKSKPAKKK